MKLKVDSIYTLPVFMGPLSICNYIIINIWLYKYSCVQIQYNKGKPHEKFIFTPIVFRSLWKLALCLRNSSAFCILQSIRLLAVGFDVDGIVRCLSSEIMLLLLLFFTDTIFRTFIPIYKPLTPSLQILVDGLFFCSIH